MLNAYRKVTMPKGLKYLIVAICGLLISGVAAIGIFAATFDPNEYKPQLIRLVQEKKQRTLTIPGEIRLSFFPRLGIDLGRLSISEHKSSTEFASVERAKVSLALIPLISKQLVVDRIDIDGLRASIRRDKDGASNYDDLVSREAPKDANAGDGKQALVLDIDSVVLRNANLVFDDRMQGRRFELGNLQLETGRIASGASGKLTFAVDAKGNKPEMQAHVTATTTYTLDLAQSRYTLNALNGELRGMLAGMKDLQLRIGGNADIEAATRRFKLDSLTFNVKGNHAGESIDARLDIPKLVVSDTAVNGGNVTGEAKLAGGARSVTASFNVPSFEGTPAAFRLPALNLDAAIREDKLDAKLRMSGAIDGSIDKQLFHSPQLALSMSGKQGDTALGGKLTTPMTVNLKTQSIEMPQLAADLNLPNPGGGTLALRAGGKASVDLGKKNVVATLNGNIDQSTFNARLGVDGFSPMAYRFDIGIDKLDLDRYKAKASTAPVPKQTPSKGDAHEQPMDFSALQKLQATGSARVGVLKVANINASNVRFDLRSANGRLDVAPLSANLYGGSAQGAITIAASKPARVALRQNLAGINVGPLLRDAIGKDPIEGRGNVQLDVTTSGVTFEQFKRALDGTARLELRDGAIRGVNIAQTVRSARTKIDALRGKESGAASQSGTGSVSEKTDFSELTGSFRITKGVARNDDLQIKSPLIRVAGSGDIDLGADRLDYLARATVVSTLQGQGGPDLQALKGVTVPVRLSGPFNAIGWRIDLAGMASELAKQKLEERKGELKEKAEKALGGEKEKIRDQLKEQLKGLLGR